MEKQFYHKWTPIIFTACVAVADIGGMNPNSFPPSFDTLPFLIARSSPHLRGLGGILGTDDRRSQKGAPFGFVRVGFRRSNQQFRVDENDPVGVAWKLPVVGREGQNGKNNIVHHVYNPVGGESVGRKDARSVAHSVSEPDLELVRPFGLALPFALRLWHLATQGIVHFVAPEFVRLDHLVENVVQQYLIQRESSFVGQKIVVKNGFVASDIQVDGFEKVNDLGIRLIKKLVDRSIEQSQQRAVDWGKQCQFFSIPNIGNLEVSITSIGEIGMRNWHANTRRPELGRENRWIKTRKPIELGDIDKEVTIQNGSNRGGKVE